MCDGDCVDLERFWELEHKVNALLQLLIGKEVRLQWVKPVHVSDSEILYSGMAHTGIVTKVDDEEITIVEEGKELVGKIRDITSPT